MTGHIETPFTATTAQQFAATLARSWGESLAGYQLHTHLYEGDLGDEWVVDVQRKVNDEHMLRYRVRDAGTPPHAVYLAVRAMEDAFAIGAKHGAKQLVDSVKSNIEKFLTNLKHS